jgi:hypothetical protein
VPEAAAPQGEPARPDPIGGDGACCGINAFSSSVLGWGLTRSRGGGEKQVIAAAVVDGVVSERHTVRSRGDAPSDAV